MESVTDMSHLEMRGVHEVTLWMHHLSVKPFILEEQLDQVGKLLVGMIWIC